MMISLSVHIKVLLTTELNCFFTYFWQEKMTLLRRLWIMCPCSTFQFRYQQNFVKMLFILTEGDKVLKSPACMSKLNFGWLSWFIYIHCKWLKIKTWIGRNVKNNSNPKPHIIRVIIQDHKTRSMKLYGLWTFMILLWCFVVIESSVISCVPPHIINTWKLLNKQL